MTVGLSSPQWIKLDANLANSLRLVLAVEFFEVETLLSFT